MTGDTLGVKQSAQFQTTHWSVVLAAGNVSSPSAAQALEHLCKRYWYPLYAFVRRQGNSASDAQDLTQMFFARLLEKNSLRLADPEKGRFRTFLLTAMKNFLINEWTKGQAERRGGAKAFVPWDSSDPEHMYATEIIGTSAECLFDKRWALAVLDRALLLLQEECRSSGKDDAFQALKSFVWGPGSTRTYNDLAQELSMNEGTVAVMVHRFRVRFRELLREEIGKTLADPADIDEELRYLAQIMST